jgi:hypothetical protein
MEQSLRSRYLDLLQAILCNTIYEDAPIPMWGEQPYSADERSGGRDWPSVAHSMIGTRRMAQLRGACETVLQEQIPGDLIETGVWRGGAGIMMRGVLAAYGDTSRRVWLADSFEGLPAPDVAQFPQDAESRFHTYAPLAVSLEQVQANFAKYGLLDQQLVFVKGWFRETLPGLPVERLAVLRLDGDMYESTRNALDNLYRRVSPGGYVIVDDYGMVPECRAATDDFRREQRIDTPMTDIDGVGVFWRVPR